LECRILPSRGTAHVPPSGQPLIAAANTSAYCRGSSDRVEAKPQILRCDGPKMATVLQASAPYSAGLPWPEYYRGGNTIDRTASIGRRCSQGICGRSGSAAPAADQNQRPERCGASVLR